MDTKAALDLLFDKLDKIDEKISQLLTATTANQVKISELERNIHTLNSDYSSFKDSVSERFEKVGTDLKELDKALTGWIARWGVIFAIVWFLLQTLAQVLVKYLM